MTFPFLLLLFSCTFFCFFVFSFSLYIYICINFLAELAGTPRELNLGWSRGPRHLWYVSVECIRIYLRQLNNGAETLQTSVVRATRMPQAWDLVSARWRVLIYTELSSCGPSALGAFPLKSNPPSS